MAIATELITKFVFQGSTKPLRLFNSSIGKSIVLLGSVASSFLVAGAVIAKWSSGVLASTNVLVQLSKQTEVSVLNIQAMGFAAVKTGSSVDAMEQSLSNLSNKIGSAVLTGDADFSRLGISVRRTNGEIKKADEIFGEIQERFRVLNLPFAAKKTLAKNLGIDATLLELLGKTTVEMRDLRLESQKFNLLNEKQVLQADAYNRSIQKLKFSFTGMKNLIAVGLAPQMKTLSDGFTDLIDKNKEFIINFSGKSIEVLTEFVKLIGRMKWHLLGLGAALAVIYSPITLTVAAVTALVLALDDLSQFAKGGKSISSKIIPVASSITAYKAIKDYFSSPVVLPSASSNGNNGTVNQTVNIDVRSADPDQAADMVFSNLQRQLNTAWELTSKGGR